MSSDLRPIAIYDSGVGGVSVLHELRRHLPHENLVYLADSAYVPYGDRSATWLEQRTLRVAHALAGLPAKLLVIPCNTATAAGIDSVRQALSLPIVGIEPAIKPAVEMSRVGKIGVLATRATVESPRYARLLTRYAQHSTVYTQACPGLADRIEAGETDIAQLRSTLEPWLAPMLAAGIDTLVLGCTHYPFIKEALCTLVGPEVHIIDNGIPIAMRTSSLLMQYHLAAPNTQQGALNWLSTQPSKQLDHVLSRLWAAPVHAHTINIPED